MSYYLLKNKIPKNWLITGGCGFIGTNLIEHLVKNYDCKIRLVDNLSVGTTENLADVCDFVVTDKPINKSDKVELWVGDILDGEMALKATKGINCIVHLAANTGVIHSIENPRQDCKVNVIGTLNYLEGARQNKVKKFIFASSGAPLGEQEPPIHEEKVPKPISPYGASKLSGEGYCIAYYESYGINTIVLRFSNVYGPRAHHKNSVVAKFIKQAINGETLKIYGDGEQTRDFIYVGDLIDAIHLLIFSDGISGEIFQLGTGQETSINELIEILIIELRNSGINNLEMVNVSPRMGEIIRNFSDSSKANNLIGWKVRIPLKEGLKYTLQYFIKHYQF